MHAVKRYRAEKQTPPFPHGILLTKSSVATWHTKKSRVVRWHTNKEASRFVCKQYPNFDVLLTMHLNIFILILTNLMH